MSIDRSRFVYSSKCYDFFSVFILKDVRFLEWLHSISCVCHVAAHFVFSKFVKYWMLLTLFVLIFSFFFLYVMLGGYLSCYVRRGLCCRVGGGGNVMLFVYKSVFVDFVVSASAVLVLLKLVFCEQLGF